MISKWISQDKNIYIGLLIYTFLLILFCSKLSPLYPLTEWADVNLYFNMGKAMMNGKILYSEVFDHKGPVIFVLYGIGYLISNTSFFGVFIIQCLLWCSMVITTYLTARMYLGKIYAFIVAVVFPVFMLTHTNDGGSAEEFIAIFQVVSLFFFIKFFKEKEPLLHKPQYMLVHGIMCALVLFTKINLTVFWVFPLAGVFLYLFLRKEYTNFIHNILAFIIGLLIIALPIVLYLWVNGALVEAWDIYIVLNKSYANIGSFSDIISKLFSSAYLRLRFDTFPFLLILLGAIYFPVRYLENKIGKVVMILSFIALYTAIFVTPRFIFYYSIPYYVYGVLGLIVLAHYLKINSNWKVYTLCAVLALWWGISKKDFFGLQFNELFGKKAGSSSLVAFTDIISQEDNPTLMNLNLNLYTTIFTKLDIVPNVKYFVSPNLSHDIYPEMRNEQTKYIEQGSIQFIIMSSWTEDYEYFNSLSVMNENYLKVDSILSSDGEKIYLYKRKDN